MRSDRELLLLAAKAAGLDVWPGTGSQAGMLFRRADKPDPFGVIAGVQWNPLTDDGDALRLAVKIGQANLIDLYLGAQSSLVSFDDGSEDFREHHGADACAATRRAIVRAAAEIGAKMQEG